MSGISNIQASSNARGRPGGLREVAVLAYPVVLTQLSTSAMHVADSAMVGRLGATELGSVGYGGIWMWTALTFFMGTASGVQTFVSQSYGAGESRGCGAWVWHALYAVVPLAAIGIGIFAALVPALLALLGPAPEMQALTADYVQTRAWGTPAVIAIMAMASFFRGFGDTRTPLVLALFAVLANVVLNYALIFGHFGLPALGVRGAGAGTAIAEWLEIGLFVFAFTRRQIHERFETRWVRPQIGATRRFLRLSAPIGGQWFLEMVSFALFSTLVARMGTPSMAATQALIALLSLSFMQAIGISVASATLVGQYMGARDFEAAARSHRSALQLGIGLSFVIGLLFIALPEPLLGIFTDDSDVLRIGIPLLTVGALLQAFDAVGIVASGSLRGAGDTRWPFLAQTGLAWFIHLPLAYTFAIPLGGGAVGAWGGTLLYLAVLASAFLGRFQNGAWREMRI